MATKPKAHGLPGLGLAETGARPRKKSAQVREGAAGGRSLVTVWAATKGTVATVLLMVLLSG